VDPISHAVFGYAVVTSVRRPAPDPAARTGKIANHSVAVTSVLGALAPDVDALLMPFGWDVYLRVHEVGTHTVFGTLPVALAVAWVIRLVASATSSTRVSKPPIATRTALVSLFGAAWLGALSHLALDVVSGARIKVAWPLIDARTHVPLVAMAEPWLLGVFIIGILSLVLVRGRRRATAITLLTAVVAFLIVKSVWLIEAVRTLDPASSAHVETQVIEARWATLREWDVFQRTDGMLQHFAIQPGQPPTLLASWLTAPTNAESPVVARSRSLDTVRNFLAVHELPFAREAANERGDTDVLWSDIRFCRPPAAADPGAAPATSPVAMTMSDRDRLLTACGLWFGGTYDRMGHALRQWVRVGSWLQTRSAGP
jgi:LexA-binding, inner membrane-associated putative hydrolase